MTSSLCSDVLGCTQSDPWVHGCAIPRRSVTEARRCTIMIPERLLSRISLFLLELPLTGRISHQSVTTSFITNPTTNSLRKRNQRASVAHHHRCTSTTMPSCVSPSPYAIPTACEAPPWSRSSRCSAAMLLAPAHARIEQKWRLLLKKLDRRLRERYQNLFLCRSREEQRKMTGRTGHVPSLCEQPPRQLHLQAEETQTTQQ